MSDRRHPKSRRAPALASLALAFSALALPHAIPLAAQDPPEAPGGATDEGSMGRIVAVLVDGANGRPINEALVSIESLGRRALSDSTGSAIFLDIPPGSYTLAVRHIAYGEQSADVDVRGMTSAIVALQLDPRAIAVAPLDVLVEQRPRYLENEGFYDRRAVGLGTFFDPLFVERWGESLTTASQFVDLLMNMSPQMSSAARTATTGGRGWEASSGYGFTGGCPAVYVDGQRTFNDIDIGGRVNREIDMMSTFMIGAVEVYPSSHGVPDFALEAEMGCGSIVIWTNRWRGRTREMGGGDVELCTPENMSLTQVEGEIRDEYTGVLLPGAAVTATWHPARGSGREPVTREIVADPQGRYRVCDVPPDHTLSLQVEAADRTGPELQVPLDARVVTRDLTLRVAGPGRVVGRVLDRATGEPISTAVIGVPESRARTQTDAQGFFVLRDVLPGDRTIEVRHLGFEPMTEVVSIVADRTVDLNIQMSANPIELEPLVVTAVRDRRLEIRGFYDRRTWGERTGLGTFLSTEDIERRSPAAVTTLLREFPGIEV
ncbi:MAG: carboxypeptidase regulatory-like domain-containing protein, partial [Gemmatimonadota bacterium]|nr:carboxypeptidase regulatory-like domain-containing protein [Gemmatimonadota bacterium]